jgi:NAD(P)-dependent dehydrogenase (short-subunit alcohol dehydrogenase family)
MAGRLDGKVALISGAARGQGAAHARRCVEESAAVVLGDVLDDEGEAVARELRDAGGRAEYLHLDVSRSADWAAAVALAEERFGSLHVLVNNAGIISEGGAVDEDEETWHRVIAVNQTGVFLGMKHAVPAMRRAGGGSIVNISSTLGVVGAEDYIAYQASKGAVRQMTKSAALSYVGDGIRVNTVCPGFVRTPMTDALDEEVHRHDIGMTPMGRPGEPIEVSHAVLFLASDEASFVTGAELYVDGGYLAQ